MTRQAPTAALRRVSALLFGTSLAALPPAVQSGCGRAAPTDPAVVCTAQLRSWVVAGRGRHLYLVIECPPPLEHLTGRVEFTESALRRGYVQPRDPEYANRIVKLGRGSVLRPPGFSPVNDRLETTYELTEQQTRCLLRDRLFTARYRLLGSNSSSAMRRALSECGCALPEHIVNAGGVLGSFPGINFDAGQEVQPDDWLRFGFADGPEPLPVSDMLPEPRSGESSVPRPREDR